MTELAEWDSFYLIVGGAAGALIGLQFVVMTLISSRPQAPPPEVGSTFATPTIVHFGTAFFLSAIVRVPWTGLTLLAIIWGLLGLVGVVYTVITARRIRSQEHYQPVFEDWLCHTALPIVAYGMFAISGLTVSSYPREALFGVGAAVLLLLLVGIHNAWDAVTWNVFSNPPKPEEPPADGTREDTDEPESP